MNSTRVLDPEQIAMRAGGPVPQLRLPEATSVFADRALRLRQLAAGHPMRDYLLFIAEVAQAQHRVLQEPRPVALTGGRLLDPSWQDDLDRLLALLRPRIVGSPAAPWVDRLAASDPAWRTAQGDAVLGAGTVELDLGTAPLVAAAQQTHATRAVLQAARLQGTNVFEHPDDPTICPCCRSAPTASIARIGGDEAGFRYLHCSLCSAQWHFVRIKCAHCRSTRGIHYQQLEPNGPEGEVAVRATGARRGAIRAECCDACGHYLKYLAMEKDPEVDPVADDLASFALDLLVSEAGFQRAGSNLMLFLGTQTEVAVQAGGP